MGVPCGEIKGIKEEKGTGMECPRCVKIRHGNLQSKPCSRSTNVCGKSGKWNVTKMVVRNVCV